MWIFHDRLKELVDKHPIFKVRDGSSDIPWAMTDIFRILAALSIRARILFIGQHLLQ